MATTPTTRRERLQDAADRQGYLLDTYSPGDGQTRYRFFLISDLGEQEEYVRKNGYFSHFGTFTALGLREAETFLGLS